MTQKCQLWPKDVAHTNELQIEGWHSFNCLKSDCLGVCKLAKPIMVWKGILSDVRLSCLHSFMSEWCAILEILLRVCVAVLYSCAWWLFNCQCFYAWKTCWAPEIFFSAHHQSSKFTLLLSWISARAFALNCSPFLIHAIDLSSCECVILFCATFFGSEKKRVDAMLIVLLAVQKVCLGDMLAAV